MWQWPCDSIARAGNQKPMLAQPGMYSAVEIKERLTQVEHTMTLGFAQAQGCRI